MPFNIGQLFVKNPYENEIDPVTGLQKRPSVWQNLAWQPEADAVLRQNYEQKQFANTNAPLASNPGYGAPGYAGSTDQGPPTPAQQQGVAANGMTNPYVRPSAATAFWHPETQKIWQQFETAPYEDQLAANRLQMLGPIQTQQEVARAREMIPVNAEQAAATHSAINKEKKKQATSEIIALQRTPIWNTMPDWMKQMAPEDIGAAIGDDPRLSNVLAQSMSAAGLKSNLPEISAAEQKAKAELETAKAHEEMKELMEEQRLDVATARARMANLHARTGLTPDMLSRTPQIANVGDTSFTVSPNTQYQSPYSLKMQDEMDFARNFQGQAKNSMLKAGDITPSIRPAMGFSGSNPMSVESSLPPSLQYGPPVPAGTQVSRPSLASQITGGVLSNALQPPDSVKWLYEHGTKPVLKGYKKAYDLTKHYLTGE